MDAHSIIYQLGGTYRAGRGQAPCPVCQPERRPDQNALSLSEQNGKILLYCFKGHCSFVDIANAVYLPLGSVQVDLEAQREAEQKQVEYKAAQLTKARSLWDVAKSIENTKAEAYLRDRGLNVITLPPSLRFMPDIYHGPSSSRCCAMIANVEPTGGVHRTYFTKQGDRLTKSAKMMLGLCCGGSVRLSQGTGPLVISEGIETGLSLLQLLTGRNPTVWATLSTSGMKGVELPKKPHKMIIGVDGDEAGREAANTLAERAAALGWSVSFMEAPEGQDWNDVLQGDCE
jgi:Toprim domain-containing protein